MSQMRYLASRTIFNDSPFAKMITGFINVLLFGCSFLFTGEMISYCPVIGYLCLVSELGLHLLVIFFEKCIRFLEVNIVVSLRFQHQI